MAKKDKDEDLIENEELDSEDESDENEEDSGGSKSEKPSKEKEEDTVEVAVDDDEEDERITVKKNKEYSEETLEEKRSRRREEKKRKRHQDFLNRQNAQKYAIENQELKKRLEALEKLAPQFKQRVDAQEEAQIDSAINSQAALYRQAEIQLEKAITEGNGAAAREAQRVMFDANNKYTQLNTLKQQHKETANQDRQQAQPKKEAATPEIGEAHRMYARRWAADNAWFDPNADDDDSEVAKIIDKQLLKEGYDPNRREFWDELTDRAKEEMPHLFEEKRPRKAAPPRPKQVNGSIGADSAPSGGKTIKIPANVMKMAEDQGFLADPKMKKIFIKNYMEQQKNSKAN